ncbi:MAG: RluA family pseudouridine synthase, partial [Crocinitomicaceae bacterium]|nr:RluA family pseudouridine synthase [Crocinitomicaceae bacterium]
MEEQPNKIVENEEEELFEHYRFLVDPGQDFIRIDKFLMDKIANTSRNKIQLAAKNGNIKVNELSVKQNYRVKPNDTISIVLPYPVRDKELIAEDIPLNIVHEDADTIVVNKPSNLVVHPGYANYTGTLVNGLLFHFENLPKSKNSEHGRPGLVHRLDKNTSGLLVVAKTEQALTHLAKQFYDRTTDRRYMALVWGDIEDQGTVT